MFTKKKKKIFFIIPTLRGGGAERTFINLIKHLNREQFFIKLLVVDTRNEVYQKEIPEDVELINLKSSRVRYSLFKLIFLLRKEKPDIVISTLGHLNMALAMIRSILPKNIKFIARETNFVSKNLMLYNYPKIWKFFYNFFCKNHDIVICLSQKLKEDYIRNFKKIPIDKVKVIPNPVDINYVKKKIKKNSINDFFEENKSINFIAAGKLSEQKGFDILIDAIIKLNNPKIKVIILGEGPLRKKLEKIIEKQGFTNQIKFVGFQENPFAWFYKADAFIHSSRFEGFSNVLLEVLACGKPIIATPSDGATCEILEKIPECILAKSIDAKALADAIKEWLNNGSKNVSEEAVKPYEIKKIVDQYEKLFTI